MVNKGKRKVALITGITGQDGSYLAELLLQKSYIVHGILRRSSSFNTRRITHLYKDSKTHKEDNMHLHYGDLTDSASLVKIISKVQPDEIYNLAGQSHVLVSFTMAEYTANVVALGTLRLLDAIRTCKLSKKVRFYQASTSELFGKLKVTPQNETTSFCPKSPCATAKLYAYWTVVSYREAYNIFACNGILYNHESPRRGETFVTRKITRGVAKIYYGHLQYIELGNLDSVRDWGHAKDFVNAMWCMLQQDTPEDYVIATGVVHSVRDFVVTAFKQIGKDIVWKGKGLKEIGKEADTGIIRVKVNPRYYRPSELSSNGAYLQGDFTKANKTFGWKPTYNFEDLVTDMVNADLALMNKDPTE